MVYSKLTFQFFISGTSRKYTIINKVSKLSFFLHFLVKSVVIKIDEAKIVNHTISKINKKRIVSNFDLEYFFSRGRINKACRAN